MDRGTAAGRLNARPSAAPRLDWARAEDGVAIAALLAEPLPGALRLVLAEDPVRCGPRADASERHHAVVVRGSDGEVLGHGARTVRRLWLDGSVRWIGYLHGLRRAAALAGDGRRLGRALARLQETRESDETDHDLTAILNGNSRARRVLEGGLPGAPTYYHLTDYATVVLDTRVAGRWSQPGIAVRRCPDVEIGAVQDFVDQQAADYAPAASIATDPQSWWTAWRGDRLVGTVRRVDRGSERREMIAGYAPWLAALRPCINLGLRAVRRPTLPAAGADLALIYAAHLIVPDGDDEVVRALLAGVVSADPCARVVWGLGAGHVLRRNLDALPAWRLASRLYAVGERPRPSSRPISPEAAWL